MLSFRLGYTSDPRRHASFCPTRSTSQPSQGSTSGRQSAPTTLTLGIILQTKERRPLPTENFSGNTKTLTLRMSTYMVRRYHPPHVSIAATLGINLQTAHSHQRGRTAINRMPSLPGLSTKIKPRRLPTTAHRLRRSQTPFFLEHPNRESRKHRWLSQISAEDTTARGIAPVHFGAGGTTSATNVANHTRGFTVMNIPPQISNPPSPRPLPSNSINNYVNTLSLELFLREHPDKGLVRYVLTGLRTGFDIGFNGVLQPIFRNNNKSARDNPEGVTQAIQKEIARGHTAGPFPQPPFPTCHVSPLGATPKPDGTCRLVLDLSQPSGCSVNDFISKEEFPTSYTHFDIATQMVVSYGRGCLLTKIDIKHAYRLLPVRTEDWPLLVFCWQGQYYVDLVLPFGGRSSASIFTSFADLVCWILTNKIKIMVIHYSDDFLMFSEPFIYQALRELGQFRDTFQRLNIPIAEDKIAGPAPQVPYLGIDIDTENFTISIPHDKITETMSKMYIWCTRRTCTQVQLQSLVGKFTFFAKVIRAGRIFTRSLIDLIYTVHRPNHHITITKQARGDIQWWCELMHSWNQASIIPDPRRIYSDTLKLYTDASGRGLGGVYNKAWIQAPWPQSWADVDIDCKELFAIVAAVYTWGKAWAGKRIVMITDNKPITQIWQTGNSPTPALMTLVRKLFLFAAKHHFSIAFKHIYGNHNPIADALSRFQMRRFEHLMPDAEPHPTAVPAAAWDLSMHNHIKH